MPRYHIPREKRSEIDISRYPQGFECGKNYVIDGEVKFPELEEYEFEMPEGTITAPKMSKTAKSKAAKAKPKREAKKPSKRGRK